MIPPGADGDEGTRGRRSLAVFIPAPAGDRAVAPHPAGVSPPALTETKEPAGGVAWPCSSLPQQAAEPSFLTPQVWSHPALTETKEPAGGVAWPCSSLPQQAAEPSFLTPQVWNPPALTETKEPAGGVVWR